MATTDDRSPGGIGFVSLVGAGPGDPLLLTRRGLEVLGRAEVVVYDHLASPRLVDLAPSGAIRISAGKSVGHKTMAQDEINATLTEHARLGRRVVRLKGGDPYLFGRGGEEAEYLADHGIPFEVVPGVTSGLGATAYAGIAVTHRDAASAVAFVTGHDDPDNVGRLDWHALAQFPGTLVIYMGVTRLRHLCRILIDGGKPPTTPAAMVESGTMPRQRVVEADLGTLPDQAQAAQVGFPALLVVGDVVARRAKLRWYEHLPLFGQRILVTRPDDSTGASIDQLERLGAEVLHAPTVEIRPVVEPSSIDRTIARLNSFDWIVFTSSNGVCHFLDRVLGSGRDLRAMGQIRIAAIGPATAEALRRYHLQADLVPLAFDSESLATSLATRAAGQRILVARADRGRDHIERVLKQVAEVEIIEVYRNVDATSVDSRVIERIRSHTLDWITLTSPAIAGRLYELLEPEDRSTVSKTIRLATISPLTSRAVKQLGWNVRVEASTASWEGLVAAIVAETNRR